MISELRRQVDGKEGKFIKVTGGDSRRQCSSHERGKRHKSDKPQHPAQSQSTAAKKFDSDKNKQNQKSKSSNSNQKSKSHKNFTNISHQSRSKSVDAHHQDQWMLRRQDHHHGDNWRVSTSSISHSLSDLSETDSWGEKLRHPVSGRQSRSRSKSRSSRDQHRDTGGDSERNYRHRDRDNVLNKFSQSGVRSGWKSKPQSHLTR